MQLSCKVLPHSRNAYPAAVIFHIHVLQLEILPYAVHASLSCLAPEGAVIKVAAVKILKHSGPAKVFDSKEDAFSGVAEGRAYPIGQGRRHDKR